MADYWKSQPRHFCEICKCWMAGNKVSISMHEQGGRHKDNVQKRIHENSKRQAEENTRQQDVKDMLEQMNRGALSGMIKDLVDDPKVARRYGSKVENTVKGKDVSGLLRQQEQRDSSPELPSGWEKLETEEGRTYYWHPASQHTQWERPLTTAESEGLMRVVEAEGLHREEKDRIAQSIQEKVEQLKTQGVIKAEAEAAVEENVATEAPNNDDSDHEDSQEGPIGPAPAPSPYGQWEVVKVRPITKVQIPEEEVKKEEEPKDEPKEEASEGKLDFSKPFKAFGLLKRPTLAPGAGIAFKKRRAVGNRNLRARDEDDDE